MYRLLVAVALLLVAVGLRAPIVAASPLLHEIQRSLTLSSAEAGLLTTLPVLCFGAFSPLAPLLARRWSMELVIFGSTVVLLAAIALRLVPSTLLLFGGTLVAGIAIAIGNVLLPALIKRDFPKNSGKMTAAYVTALTLGAALPAGLTVPLERAAGLDWRAALALWGFVPALALLMWIPQLRAGHRIAATTYRIPLRALLRDHVAWYVTAFMGFQSLGFYTTTAWLPTLFVSHGMDARSAGWLLLIANRNGAESDARAYLDLNGSHDKLAPYMSLLGALAARRAGHEVEARVFLDEAIANLDPSAWPAPVLRYLRRGVPPQSVLDAAHTDLQKTEAHVFIGLSLFQSGDSHGAVAHLRWVRDRGVTHSIANDLARETLKKIDDLPPLPIQP